MTKLNPRQEAFCRAIRLGKTAREAAIAAGYSEASADANGPRLLRNDRIRQRLQELAGAEEERARVLGEITPEQIEHHLWGIVTNSDAKHADQIQAVRELNKMRGHHAPKQHVVEASVEARGPDLELLKHPEYRKASMALGKLAEKLRAE